MPRREPLAIVGIGCRLPGDANTPEDFWKLLRDGVDAISEIPADRWNIKTFYDSKPGTPGKTNACRGGFIKGIDAFDAGFFGISPREAARMDPQQRILLEVAWEALEDAGQVVGELAGSDTGVFIGLSSSDYMMLQQSGDLDAIDAHTNTGGAMSIAANRISYCLNLQGPSIALDTACSSSLVAVHQACQSIWEGDSRMALAGGVNVLIKPEPYVGFSRLSMLSPDGQCRAFAASANGFVRSEGAAIVVLKRLSDALANGDSIYALIRSSAVNQDGHTTGLTVPSEEAQTTLVREACKLAGIRPSQVQLVEAHGPGTLVGDPIEARALGAVLAARERTKECFLGSVKTNIGHLEPAAGIAGLVKVALALKHGEIPRNLHFDAPNPDIPFHKLKLRVPTSGEPWSYEDGPPLAGVNSFGFGGTNSHVILQGIEDTTASPRKRTGQVVREQQLIPLSARSPEALKALARSYAGHIAGDGAGLSLGDIAYTASKRRDHHDRRLAIVARSQAELVEQLEAHAAGESRPGTVVGRVAPDQQPKIVFVCSGQGPQWWAMGRQLIENEPVFREMIEKCDAIVRKLGPWSLLEELTAEDEASSRMQKTSIAQPAIFAIQVALARLWESWGIRPDAVVGHSVGEVAAAYLAGVFSLEDAVRVIYHRGRCMDFASAYGKMLAVSLPLDEARRLVRGKEDRISLAAHNSPTSVTLSGDGSTLEAIAAELEQRSVYCKFLRVEYAFHSPQMDPMQDALLAALDGLEPRRAALPIYSTVTGRRAQGKRMNAEYWWHNVREYVRFTPTVDALLDEGYNVFVELAPHPVLSGSINESVHQRRSKVTVVHSLRRGEDEQHSMLKALGSLHTVGCSVDWNALSGDGASVRLPGYAWQHESFWYEGEESKRFRTALPAHPLLGRRLASAKPTWQTKVDSRVTRYLNDHRVQGSVLLSGTSYLEMALAAAKELYGPGSYAVEEVELGKACFLPDAAATTLQLVVNLDESSFSIHSRPKDNGQAWTDHVNGKVRVYESNGTNGHAVSLDDIRKRCPHEVLHDACYEQLQQVGLDYGPTFKGIESMWSGNREALGRICVPEALNGELEGYLVHPAVLDACFQVITGTLPNGKNGAETHASAGSAEVPGANGSNGSNGKHGGGSVYLPVEFGQVKIRGPIKGSLWSHARLVEENGKSVVAEVDVFDESGIPVLEVRGFRCQAIEEGRSVSSDEKTNELVYEYQWVLSPRPGQAAAHRSAAHLQGPLSIQEETRIEAQRVGQELGTERNDEMEGKNNGLCSAFILEAFAKLGPPMQPGERFTTDAFSASRGIDKRYWRLMNRYLEMLQEDGTLRRYGHEWEVVSLPELPEAQAMWQAQMVKGPAYYAELTLLGRCGQQLAEILRGEVDPLHLIFPDGSLAIAEHLYQDSPSLRYNNTLARKAVTAALDNLAEGKTVRILEIGAGTGGLSSYVLPKLPADRTEYVYTDLSNHFFLKAEEKFKDYPFIEYKRLDIEQDPMEQGLEPHSFDIILASECLHATADLRTTLGNVKRLLASEGLLLLIEGVTRIRWVDLVFGLTEGWWRFADLDLRPDYPLMPLATWRSVLEDFGFSEVIEASARPEKEVGNAVIVARGAAIEDATGTAAGTAAEAEEPAAQESTTIIYADDGGFGRALATELRTRGESCVLVYEGKAFQRVDDETFEILSDSAGDVSRLFEEVSDSGRPACRRIVHLWNLDGPATSDVTLKSLNKHMVRGCLSAIHLALALGEIDAEEVPRLWVVTRGAQSVGRGIESTAAAQASAWGLGRVVMNEIPKLRTMIVDLDPEAHDGTARDVQVRSLADELVVSSLEDEIALRGEARYVHRYVRTVDQEASQGARITVAAGTVPYRLETSRQGVLDKLILRETKHRQLKPDEVEIQIAAAGLNFADVMKALGLYPGLPDGPIPLGIECSGRIVAVGDSVQGFKPGDDVVAIAPFAFGSFATTEARLVAHKPEHLTYEEGATIPIAFLTSHYAMNYLGRMERGERILIHSATGGVGQAAIQLAQLAGLEILATAGTPEKREFLRSQGIEHVMDSRSLEFADEVLEATGGEGVDLCLNSLAGEAIRKGLNVLRSYGRFLEIGKRDIYANSRVGLRPFRKNLQFMAIDLDSAMREKPELMARLFQELMDQFQDRKLTPLPYRVFPISNVVSAFRYMAQAKHIGKVVVSMQEQDASIVPAPVEELTFREDGTYLMTGGLGGFGVTVAKWMVAQGARHLVLMGRSGASSDDAKAALEIMREAGAEVVVAQADVTSPKDVAQVLADIDAKMPPLRGVLHAAMVLKDRLMMDLNRKRMEEVWAPKVDGAWNLHNQTLDRKLDFFVLFSSLSSVFGFAGQANYASANAFLDSLAYYRRSRGLPAVTISWGFLGQVGWVAQHGNIAERLESQGVRSFSPEQALTLLGRIIQKQKVHVGVMSMDWRKWAEVTASVAPVPGRFADLVNEGAQGAQDSLRKSDSAVRAALLAADPGERLEMLEQLLRNQVARVLGASPDKLDMDKPLTELGLDSLMAVELRNWIEGDLRLSLPTVELMKGPSVEKLAVLLYDQLAKLEGSAAKAPGEIRKMPTEDAGQQKAAEAEDLLARIDDLPDEQIDALLNQMAAKGEEATE